MSETSFIAPPRLIKAMEGWVREEVEAAAIRTGGRIREGIAINPSGVVTHFEASAEGPTIEAVARGLVEKINAEHIAVPCRNAFAWRMLPEIRMAPRFTGGFMGYLRFYVLDDGAQT
jgi:hypothetical protein